MIIWKNTKDSNWQSGWRGKLSAGSYAIDIVRYTGKVKLKDKNGILTSLGLPPSNVTYKNIVTGKKVTTTDNIFIDHVRGHVILPLNILFSDLGINITFELNNKITNRSELPSPYRFGTREFNTWSIYNTLPTNDKKFFDGVFDDPRTACGLALYETECVRTAHDITNCGISFFHETLHNVGFLHEGNTGTIGINLESIKQVNNGKNKLELHNHLMGLYGYTSTNPIIISGIIDKNSFTLYSNEIEDVMAFLAIDGKIVMQSTVDVNGEFRFYIPEEYKDNSGDVITIQIIPEIDPNLMLIDKRLYTADTNNGSISDSQNILNRIISDVARKYYILRNTIKSKVINPVNVVLDNLDRMSAYSNTLKPVKFLFNRISTTINTRKFINIKPNNPCYSVQDFKQKTDISLID